jgi:hypothetical protein
MEGLGLLIWTPTCSYHLLPLSYWLNADGHSKSDYCHQEYWSMVGERHAGHAYAVTAIVDSPAIRSNQVGLKT